jgi:hypothetical protein
MMMQNILILLFSYIVTRFYCSVNSRLARLFNRKTCILTFTSDLRIKSRKNSKG